MPEFKIAGAQIASIRGDIDANIANHASAIIAAAKHRISVLVFPELSLTGYQPDLAADLAITKEDCRLQPLVALASQHRIEVVLGAPLRNGSARPSLGAIMIAADGSTKTYCKMHLGGNEPNYFTSGDTPLALTVNGHNVGIGICADASQTTHPQAYADAGSDIYAVGVFLNDEWYKTDAPRLAGFAARHQMLVVMANHGASFGTLSSVGKSAVWSPDGTILAQAEGTESALVIAKAIDLEWSGEVVKI